MLRLLRSSLLVIGVLLAVGAATLYVAVPFLERRMTFFPQAFAVQTPAGAQDVRFQTEDGVRLHGWFFDGAAPQAGITFLILHGNAGNISHFAADAAFLQARGFDVFLVDYRGYGRSEGETLSEATLFLDGAAAMRYLTAERGIDPARIALYGYSLGTAVAAELAVTGPCCALVLVAPLASARQQARLAMPSMPDFFFDRLRNRFDTVGKIARSNCPVLVIHGTDDTVIPLAQGRAVYEAAADPKRLVVIPGGRHWLAASHGHLGEIASFALAPR